MAAPSASELVGTVVEVAAGALPAVRAATVSLRTDGERSFETLNASSPIARTFDEAQYASGSGPCVEAIQSGAEVREWLPSGRWPEFSAVAVAASVRSVWSLPLQVEDRLWASLNLYRSEDGSWDERTEALARLMARQAADVLASSVALAQREHINVTLRRALETRTAIGQAQGVLMARQGIGPDEAFDILRRASQRTNRKLRDVAAEIVAGAASSGPRP